MTYASFTSLPANVGRDIPASRGKRRLTVMLTSAGVCELLFVAIAAYFAAVLYHRLILMYSPDPARYLPEAVATLTLLACLGHRQYSRIQRQPAMLCDGLRTDNVVVCCSVPLRRAWSMPGASFL